MGSLVIVLTAFAVYCSEAYCDTLPTKVAKPEDTALLGKSNDSHATVEKGSFWKNLNLPRYKPTKTEESRNLSGKSSEADRRKGRFLNSLAFLTGLSFGGLATAASSTMKTIANKMPQVFSINLGSTKTSPYLTAYYSQYPYAPLLPYPFFYPGPFGLAPMIDAVKPQTSQNDLTPQVINLLDNRPIDLAENNEDYTDAEKSGAGNGADDRIRLRAEADRNAEEKVRGCKESQRKHVKGMAREREYFQVNDANLRVNMNLPNSNETVNATTTRPPNNHTSTNTTHHYHHHHHHHGGGHNFPGYYGGYPQNIHHVDLTTTQPYSQISYNVPYEQPNFYHDDKYNAYLGHNPSFPTPPFSSDQINEYPITDFNQLHPSYQLPNNSHGFKPLK